MKRCLWYRRKKSRKEVAVNDLTLNRDSDDDGMKDKIWFDSKLVFESDSDDDFKSVNGDSFPSNFGYSYTSQGATRPSFKSLRERMEELVQEKGACEAFAQSESGQNVPEEKKTLGQLFTAKLEHDKDIESGKKHPEIPRQGSKERHQSSEVSQRSCFSGLIPSVGLGKKSPSSPVTQKTDNAQSWLSYRLCVS